MAYFQHFDSFVTVQQAGKPFTVVVERLSGDAVTSSPIPQEALDDVIDEIGAAEAGGAMHVWKGNTKELITVPNSQIASIRVMFQ